MIVIKRDGRKQKFNQRKIFQAILAAMNDIGDINPDLCGEMTDEVIAEIEKSDTSKIDVESIQDLVQKVLVNHGLDKLVENYILYRKKRSDVRDLNSSLMTTIAGISKETVRDNANVGNGASPKMLQIGSEASKWFNLSHMPPVHAEAHKAGDIHIHDLDYFEKTINCLQIDIAELLESGFSTGYGWIRKPKNIESAAALTCIVLQSSQNDMYGGQSIVDFDNGLAPYVDMTRSKILRDVLEDYCEFSESIWVSMGTPDIRSFSETEQEKIIPIVEKRVAKSTYQAMQAVIYNLNSMHSRAGAQVPFSTINIGLPKSKDAALVCEMILKALNDGLGRGETPIFPNIVFRIADGVNYKESDPYFYLFKLAVEVAAKRMNPTFLSQDSDLSAPFYKQGIDTAAMGCRTFIGSNCNGDLGPSKRGNIAPVTINLPRIAIRAKGDINKFYKLLADMMKLSEEELLYRKSILAKLLGKDLPFTVGQRLYRGSEKVAHNDSIEEVLKQGTYAIGSRR